ncbi:PEP-CTERM sorting domain-containing protein [Marinobacter lacisalsi]|uniref:PEP-CTERM sorting domain-containing protein n=1 Tax=Marinobacter lacisalsi TaxID=475979 RepID=A0ABV8QJH6_9GAMM
MNRLLLSTIALAGLTAAQSAVAGYMPTSCDATNASANGSLSVECRDNNTSGYPADNGDGTLTIFMNTVWSDYGPLTTVVKDGTSSGGFSFSVSDADSGSGFENYFEFFLPADYLGSEVDWVLAVKQSGYLVSYLFEDLLVENDQPAITGYFNSPWQNGSDDFSWAGGLVGEPSTPIPEPGSLALIGLGLVGLGALRRRASRA